MKASEGERREAMRNAQGFIKAKGLKPETNITRVIDGGEPSEFKTLFKRWKDAGEVTNFSRQTSAGPGRGIARTVQTKFDAKTLHENPKVAASTGMVDDGSGVIEVFRVEMFDLIPVEKDQHGIFFSGDCFVIYYWLGANSSQDEQGAAALRTIELDDKLKGLPVQVRVVQGKEPAHFLAMFGGKMTIFQGVTASSLNTNDCFVLVTPDEVIVWYGKGSTGDEREMAKTIALSKSPDPEFMFEGQEKKNFWEALGGKQPYFDEKVLKQDEEIYPPRLFQLSNASGYITVEEIAEFDQDDLIEEDVMILDATHTIFAWFGVSSNRNEQQECVRIAKEYLESCPNERDGDTPIMLIKQGLDPPNFTGHFGSWDENKWNVEELYAQAAEANKGPVEVTNGFTLGYSNTGSF